VRYMLMVCDDGKDLQGPAEINAKPQFAAWMEDLARRGLSRGRTLLRPPAEATTVRVRDGQRFVSDGPFSETKEWVAGVEIVECANLDEAIKIARTHPDACRFPIEIRPFWED
jgi:hypothetical protein